MKKLEFKLNQIMQIAFTVGDIEKAMVDYGRDFNIGVWFAFKNISFDEMSYRGAPSETKIMGAIGYSGEMMYELIQQVDDSPSVYRETTDKRGYGFHHVGIIVPNLVQAVEKYRAQGYECAMAVRSSFGIKAAYMDAGVVLPGMLELLEQSDSLTQLFQPVYEASLAWNGSEPQIQWL